MPETAAPKKRSVGGVIPEDLYWRFKKAQADRHESSVQALEIAIRLYLECCPLDYENMRGETDGQ